MELQKNKTTPRPGNKKPTKCNHSFMCILLDLERLAQSGHIHCPGTSTDNAGSSDSDSNKENVVQGNTGCRVEATGQGHGQAHQSSQPGYWQRLQTHLDQHLLTLRLSLDADTQAIEGCREITGTCADQKQDVVMNLAATLVEHTAEGLVMRMTTPNTHLVLGLGLTLLHMEPRNGVEPSPHQRASNA
jgi:hypothetical protein